MERDEKQDRKVEQGVDQMTMLHSLEAAGLAEKVDAWDMNEAHQDPKQELPRPRSDLPKNKHHESIHNP